MQVSFAALRHLHAALLGATAVRALQAAQPVCSRVFTLALLGSPVCASITSMPVYQHPPHAVQQACLSSLLNHARHTVLSSMPLLMPGAVLPCSLRQVWQP